MNQQPARTVPGGPPSHMSSSSALHSSRSTRAARTIAIQAEKSCQSPRASPILRAPFFMSENRIDSTFAKLRAERRAGFIAYLCAGDPTLVGPTVAVALGMAGLLGLLRLCRLIPVERRGTEGDRAG